MTAETWVPGDPLMPDNGCGYIPPTPMTDDERAAVIAEGGPPPPWWRPPNESGGRSATRHCTPCGVKWAGPDPCWMCGQVTA